MKCPFCGFEDSKVTDSRNSSETSAIKRRRQCLSCLRRFTTYETVDFPLQVLKRDGTFEDFSLEKLTRGIAACCRHTRIPSSDCRVIASEIAAEIFEKQPKQVSSMQIGEAVMQKLKLLDSVAYIRFACVYKRFKDMDELMDAIQTAAGNEETNGT